MRNTSTLTAAQEILLAAEALHQKQGEFSEWDLTVAVWERNKNRFGCRGHEQYPDHKRVMMEIMGQTKKDNPIRRGWLKKTRPNCYRLTPLGDAEALALAARTSTISPVARSSQSLYDSVYPYLAHRAFREFSKNPGEPKTWLQAASFLGITKNDRVHFEDRLRAVQGAIDLATEWFELHDEPVMRRGVTGGGVAVTKDDIDRLARFVQVLLERFDLQVQAIRRIKT